MCVCMRVWGVWVGVCAWVSVWRCTHTWTVWPSGLRRWLQAPVRKGVGSNPTAVTFPAPASGPGQPGGETQAPWRLTAAHLI